MSDAITTQVLVVGGGPGGYVAAIRAGQLGLKTVLVEADQLGGTCLIRGCIPSKALIHSASKFADLAQHVGDGALGIRLAAPPTFELGGAVHWKNGIVTRLSGGVAALLKKARVQVIGGWARFEDGKSCIVEGDGTTTHITAEHVIIATGSVPVELPGLPFGGDVLSSSTALSLPELPKHLAVIGAGYIGMELGIAFRKMGARVTVIEATDRMLPSYDSDLVKPVSKWCRQHDIDIRFDTRAVGYSAGQLELESADGTSVLDCDKVLVTVGRKPNTQGWGLDRLVIDMDGAFIRVNDSCQTSMRKVWAIGDVVGEPMLAHKASAQGEMVAEIIAGERRKFAPAAIPAVCFTEPEIAGAGLSPDEAAAAGFEVKVGSFPLAANGRSLTMEGGTDGGFVRVTARADNHLILGVHAVGAHVSELTGAFVQAIEMGAVLEDLAGIIQVHPTVSEAFHEAALATLGHAIHA
jgi:dihydrolipoamide dehydrogenase